MSKKRNKQRDSQPVLKQEISIHDDPYWKVSNLYVDPHRVGRYLAKFERLSEEYQDWTEMLLEGVPTFYCILGVYRGASGEEIEKAYAKKSEFSFFSGFILDEAYDVLGDKALQKQYDELLSVFEQMTKCMSPPEKKELIDNHNKNINKEKEFIRMGEIRSKYRDYLNIYMLGAPDLYTIIGLDPGSTPEAIKKQSETGSELYKKIFTILGDPGKRAEYDYAINFVMRNANPEKDEERNRRAKKWETIDRKTFEKIIINSIDPAGGTEDFEKRMCDIMSDNQDWALYLPPGKETFFSIIGIERSSLSGDKKEIEKMLREKYRYLEKTPKVNLAYSVLKNESQRADYLWIGDNIDVFNAMEKISSDKEAEEEVPLRKVKTGKGKRQGKKQKPESQMTFEDLDKIFRNILENSAKKHNW